MSIRRFSNAGVRLESATTRPVVGNSMTSHPKMIFCVSWDAMLSESRVQLFRHAGFSVRSAVGEAEALAACRENADLMVLGHSVPRDTKRLLIQEFHKNHNAPVLSLLRHGE